MTELKKALSLYGLTMVAIGSCIGSGIFLTPAQIAGILPSPLLILGAWLVGGVIGLTGALSYAEVGALFPKAGGIYAFLKEAYGDIFGFLFGWTTILVVNTGAIAALCLAFANYVAFVIPMSQTSITLLGAFAIVFITAVNLFGVKMGELFANVFTGLKLIGILVVIGVGLFLGTSATNDFNPAGIGESLGNLETNPFTAFGLALIGVVFSFGGFQHASYLAAEAKNVKRNLPLSMILAVVVVSVTYISINVAYFYLLPVDQIAGSSSVAADAVTTLFPSGAVFIAILIAVSTLGTAGVMTLSAPRIYFAMASDGLFPKKLAELHPKYKVPANAILAQSVWALALLLFWETFNDLITYVVFTDWIFLTLAGSSVFVFRRKLKDAHRPYKTWGYPVTPAIFVGIGTFIVLNTLIQKPTHALAGLVFLVLGVPVYHYFKKRYGS